VGIRIASRGSALALWQAEHVRGRLRELGHEATIRVITTTGDRLLDRRLETVGGKGAFLKEIEEAMQRGEVDLAVHSLKDVPIALPDGLRLAAVLPRADPRDALLSAGRGLQDLPSGARVGTTSLRRQSQLLCLRPDLVPVDLRGNVDSRIRKLHERLYDAIVLAMAGLTRLGRQDEATEVLDADRFVPAPGQGAIALECRSDDERVRSAVQALDHAPTALAVGAERAFLAELGGGCNVPLGAYARFVPEGLRLSAFVGTVDGTTVLRGEKTGPDPESLGRALADEMKALGAREVMTRLDRS
jgi:hydroxymethylbilane synthase